MAGETPGWQPQPSGVEPPAGWYPDPQGRFPLRYWQGDRWTSRVRVGKAEATDHGTEGGDSATSAWTRMQQQGGSWHPDPTGRFAERLWDGERWTRQIRVGQFEATDTLSVPQRMRPPAGVQVRPATRTGSSSAGWRPDPADPRFERYWDGYQWTAKLREVGSGARSGSAAWLRGALPLRVKLAVVLMLTLLTAAVVAVVVWLVVG